MQYASDELKNDKKIVLFACQQSGVSLKAASKELQNDFELLNLLKNYHIDNINDANYGNEYKTWYKERMTVLDILNQQLFLNDIISTNTGKAKTRKF